MFRIIKPIDNPDAFRGNVRNKLKEMFNERHEDIEKEKLDKFTKHLERGIFNYTLELATTKKVVKKWDNPAFLNLYLTKFRSIHYHFTTFPYIIEKIANKEWSARDIASMSAQELNPERWNSLIQSKLERDKNLFNEDFQAATDQFTCWKCKKKKCVFYELQTSSGDESTTIFITCLSCGNRWKTR